MSMAEQFVSHAQNLEDVVLWRALRDVPEGFYIDAGAEHPLLGSVTMAFHERGWRGINIEPNEAYFELLAAQRPRDVNLKCAVSDQPGTQTFHTVVDTGLSTLVEDIATGHASAGRTVTGSTVEVTTLDRIWERHVGDQAVHFLKIDVEGYEEQALRGLDLTRRRPWIVVVEATRPLSQTPSFETWDPILVDARYDLVYRDGLNRFYLAREHAALRDRFDAPPNVFDAYVTARQAEMETIAASACRQLDIVSENLRAAHLSLAAAEHALKETEARYTETEAHYRVAEVELRAIWDTWLWRCLGWMWSLGRPRKTPRP